MNATLINMYFWDTRKLGKELANLIVTAKQKMLYMLASQVMFTLFIYQALYTYEKIDSFFIVEFLTVLLVVVLGVIKCYDANGKSDGRNFIENFVCLSVPLTVKISILVFGLFYIYQLVGGYAFNIFTSIDTQIAHSYVTFIISIFGQILFFSRMSTHLAVIRNSL